MEDLHTIEEKLKTPEVAEFFEKEDMSYEYEQMLDRMDRLIRAKGVINSAWKLRKQY